MTFSLPLCEPRFLHVQYGGDHANWENCSEDTITMPSAWIYTNTYPPLGGGLSLQIWWHKVYFPRAFWAGTLFQLVVMSGGIGVHSHASCHASVLPSSTIPFLPTLDSSPPLVTILRKTIHRKEVAHSVLTLIKVSDPPRTEYHGWRPHPWLRHRVLILSLQFPEVVT